MSGDSGNREESWGDELEQRWERELGHKREELRRLRTQLWRSFAGGVVLLLVVFVVTLFTASSRLVPSAEQRKSLDTLITSVHRLQSVFDSLSDATPAALNQQPTTATAQPAGDTQQPQAPIDDEAATPEASAIVIDSASSTDAADEHHRVPASRLMAEALTATERMAVSAQQITRIPLPSQLAIAQIVPVGAVVLILGLLGLRRMQGYDHEIGETRREVTETVNSRLRSTQEQMRHYREEIGQSRVELSKSLNARLEEARAATGATIASSVAKGFSDQQEQLKMVQAEIADLHSRSLDEANTAQKRMSELMQRVKELIEGNPWLAEATAKEWLDRVNSLRTAEQAHDLARAFLGETPPNLAAGLAALGAVAPLDGDPLPGDASAYHNCFVEAMRSPTQDATLAARIVNAGRTRHPDNADLIADLVQVRSHLGESLPTVELERLRESGSYWASWRTVVFEAQAISESGTHTDRKRAIKLLEEGTKHLKRDPRVWRHLADHYCKLGDEDKAESTFKRGLKACMSGQVLAYNFGDFLLSIGRAEDAVQMLERAMAMDYQEQYQPDVSQGAVMLTTAQACEAASERHRAAGEDEAATEYHSKAATIYRRFLAAVAATHVKSESPHMTRYALSRLALLGEPADDPSGMGFDTQDSEGKIDSRQMLAAVEAQADKIDPETCERIIHDLAGPPTEKDRWLRLLDGWRKLHGWSDEKHEELRRLIESRYPD